ncbi:MAG: phospho-sugar mutase [Oscillospiraceae bacterium]|nr:phospho-sugar mutase [Oscillospiraceae bacterium]
MNDIKALYELWLQKAEEPEVVSELKSIEGNEEEILDRFWQDLTFGTGGLRGVLGAGTNRMNVYTVGKATQGLANFLNSEYTSPSVVIGYDSRINSDKFARIAAEVLAANGIKVYIFPELMPTPIVAYAVKELSCSSGIIITASHNPSKYNGYKCYDSRGYQMTDEAAAKTLEYINACDIFEDVNRMDFNKGVELGVINILPESFLDKYFELVKKCSVVPDAAENSDLSVIYTPLNGTGNKQVRRILKEMGFTDVTVVPSQENPDGNFPTCSFPNPEIKEAFAEALKLSETKKADLLLATDPDCDRVGIAVLSGGEYKLVTGNDVGCMLTDYIISQKKAAGTLPEKPIIIKSIVSTDMATAIADSYGAEIYNVLTGFKYIGEKMTLLQNAGEGERFLLGFEESYGYLSGMHALDKDAVNASFLICEMAAFYKKQGKTLIDVLEALHSRFGFWENSLFNFYFEGANGMVKMTEMMEGLRKSYPTSLGNNAIVKATDYKEGKEICLKTGETADTTLPKSNVIVLEAENRDKIIVRPAGTEPKIKIYTMVQGRDEAEAKAQTEKYKNDITAILGIEE